MNQKNLSFIVMSAGALMYVLNSKEKPLSPMEVKQGDNSKKGLGVALFVIGGLLYLTAKKD